MALLSVSRELLLAGACSGAFGFGALASGFALRWVSRTRASFARRTRQRAERMPSGEGAALGEGDLSSRLIAYARSRTQAGGARARVPGGLGGMGLEGLARDIRQAGQDGEVTLAGVADARLRLAIVLAAVFALVASLISFELAVLLALVGFALGWASLGWAFRERKRIRAAELERHLPEMLEVVALGLRSGLSFERSLEVYTQYFDTLLSRSFASVQKQWSFGLATREDALRRLSASYDSALFSRCVENIVRSLRFGSSMAESLETCASEARLAYRARKQEQVAKAPVKMMLPTGALMLPAMLLLVLGPVLLELMEGF